MMFKNYSVKHSTLNPTYFGGVFFIQRLLIKTLNTHNKTRLWHPGVVYV